MFDLFTASDELRVFFIVDWRLYIYSSGVCWLQEDVVCSEDSASLRLWRVEIREGRFEVLMLESLSSWSCSFTFCSSLQTLRDQSSWNYFLWRVSGLGFSVNEFRHPGGARSISLAESCCSFSFKGINEVFKLLIWCLINGSRWWLLLSINIYILSEKHWITKHTLTVWVHESPLNTYRNNSIFTDSMINK